jgi:hypothetical protein
MWTGEAITGLFASEVLLIANAPKTKKAMSEDLVFIRVIFIKVGSLR